MIAEAVAQRIDVAKTMLPAPDALADAKAVLVSETSSLSITVISSGMLIHNALPMITFLHRYRLSKPLR